MAPEEWDEMNCITANHTDKGIKKNTNQDALLIKQAQTDYGNVLLACVCDGMGGLAKGEVASSTMIMALSDWFDKELPALLYAGFDAELLKASWEQLVYNVNIKLKNYGAGTHAILGTTCAAFLLIDKSYYIINVGDSRIYLISDKVYQLTKDQTVCQRDIDMGLMTEEEAAVSSNRSVLLQCIGAMDVVTPDFFAGTAENQQCYMICSDGFRHLITPEEIYERLNPYVSVDASVMKQNLEYLINLNMERNERDNISALLIKTI